MGGGVLGFDELSSSYKCLVEQQHQQQQQQPQQQQQRVNESVSVPASYRPRAAGT
jgi:transcription initiation factor TFIID subunit TAF12